MKERMELFMNEDGVLDEFEGIKFSSKKIADEFFNQYVKVEDVRKVIIQEVRMERFAYGQSYKKACDEIIKDILHGLKITAKTGSGGKGK